MDTVVPKLDNDKPQNITFGTKVSEVKNLSDTNSIKILPLGEEIKSKVQFGAAWWFLDQKDGIKDQLDATSNMGLLSCSVGMLTDSRSFLSFPRHF